MSRLPPERIAHVLRRAAGEATPLWLEAAGPSMQPAIPAGARVRIAAATRPRWGEVWAFCDSDGVVVVHRYRGKRGARFVFQGDAGVAPDQPVPMERLVGRVVTVDVDGRHRHLGGADRWRGGWRLLVSAAPRRRGRHV